MREQPSIIRTEKEIFIKRGVEENLPAGGVATGVKTGFPFIVMKLVWIAKWKFSADATGCLLLSSEKLKLR